MAPKEFIVAIELGSSKMTGIAGKKNLDGSISILAVVKEDSSSFIRKGVIYNIDKTAQCISNIVKRLTTQLKTSIVTQEYKVDNQYQIDPVGIQCTRLEGNFLNILWRKEFYRKLNKCFDMADVAIAEMYLAPLALADSVLTDAEKRSGCALVDLGADTTTVSVYYKNILRHLAVIPLGSNNITKDIASLQMEESQAEEMKLKYANAWTDNSEIDNSLMLNIDGDRTVESRKFIEIVEGRVEEIIENVWFQVPSEYADRLLGGIILTGGGSNLRSIETAFRNRTHVEKIRIARFVQQSIQSKDPLITSQNAMMNTVLGLLAKGDINCAGPEINGDLFGNNTGNQPGGTQNAAQSREPRKANEIEPGVVLTEAEKQKAEEERRRQEELAEAERQREIEENLRRQRELEEEEQRKRKENSGVKKMGKRLSKFIKGLISEPEDE